MYVPVASSSISPESARRIRMHSNSNSAVDVSVQLSPSERAQKPHRYDGQLDEKRVQTDADAEPRRRTRWRVLRRVTALLGMAALSVATFFVLAHYSQTDEFSHVIDWIQTHELVGSAVYVSSFSIFLVLCFPSTAFELLAGYIFGFWLGLLLATIGKLLGSVLSFVIGRYLCRHRVRAYMTRGHPILQAFQSLLHKREVLVVFLTRVAFFPIAVKNYGLSVLDVRFPVYFAAALITGLPFSVIWVYSGHAAKHLTSLLSGDKGSSSHSTEIVLLVVGGGSALLLLCFVGLYTRKYVLAMAEEEKNSGPATAVSTTTSSSDESALFASAV